MRSLKTEAPPGVSLRCFVCRRLQHHTLVKCTRQLKGLRFKRSKLFIEPGSEMSITGALKKRVQILISYGLSKVPQMLTCGIKLSARELARARPCGQSTRHPKAVAMTPRFRMGLSELQQLSCRLDIGAWVESLARLRRYESLYVQQASARS